ncbi:MAG: SPOR domain-containing protein, partial [Rickettsiales bacterium]|nr:SPOR domain-containing protein [Rickettsiales bacterium]
MTLLTSGLPVSTAFAAQDEYFVEVGDDVRKEDAEQTWGALVAKHKMLAKLKLYPKDILQGEQQVTTRLQAGPITSKAQALKICTKLFKADVPCFVIEGVNDVPPAAMMHLNQKNGVMASNGSLPWLSAKADVIAAPVVKGEDTASDGSQREVAEAKKEDKESSSFFSLPWMDDEDEKEEAKAEKPAEKSSDRKVPQEQELAAKQAKVQVAEAIRVPLTQTNTLEDEIRVRALPELKPSFGIRQLRDESNEMGTLNSGAGWLNVGDFVNEEIASSMWEEVRSANRKQVKNVNMRMEKAAVDKSDTKTTLAVGPFANSAEAYKFCRSGLQANERGLRCSFVAND